MKKKLILIGSVSITVIAAAALILFFVLTKDTIREEEIVESKEKSPDTTQSYTLSEKEILASGEKCIAAKSGLNLRSSPNKSSKVISLILFGAKVTINKSEGDEIFLDGRYGKWVNVKYGNSTGWVFSGFLCDFKPDTIIKIAADHYRNQYRKHGYFPEEFTNFKDSAVSIESIIDKYIVLNAPTTTGVSVDLVSGNVVWKYDVRGGKFSEVHNVGQSNNTRLLHLNKDKYPDMIITYGCCNSIYIEIFLGSGYGFSNIFNGYSNDDLYMTVGHCGDTEFAYTNIDHSEKTDPVISFFRFNCEDNRVEGYGEGKVIEAEGIISSIDLKKMSIDLIDKKDSKERSYRIYKVYASENSESLNKLQMGDNISFSYANIDGKRIVFSISKHEGYQGSSKG